MASTYWDDSSLENEVERNGVTTLTIAHHDQDYTALVVMQRDAGIERHILPALRRLGGGQYAALEDALRRGALPGAIARDLHRLLKQAESRVDDAKRAARMDVMRGRLR